ncbi:MAG: hypothetical protein WA144_15390 [Candidatus Methanoperedens sp.]
MDFIPIFIGYSAGRIGHIAGGADNPSFHHWIIGLLLYLYSTDQFMKMVGLGLFISDLNDALNLRIYGIAPVDEYVFWGID